MPKPFPGQSQDDFIANCIPQVLQDGTAENQQQAIAICFSMWEEAKKEINDKIEEL
jgi:hypothetical protein